jgi:hypothetical protein
MNMQHWSNDSDSTKIMFLNTHLSRCHSLHHKSHMNWPGIEPRPMQWKTINCLIYDTVTALVDTAVPFMYLSSQYCYNNLSFLLALCVPHSFKQLISNIIFYQLQLHPQQKTMCLFCMKHSLNAAITSPSLYFMSGKWQLMQSIPS